MDLYAGNWGVNGLYMRLLTNADGTLNFSGGFSVSSGSTLPNEGTNFTADPSAITYIPSSSGAILETAPWRLNERIYQALNGHVIFRVDVGASSALWDLSQTYSRTGADYLTDDTGGTAFGNGALDWQNVTPVFFTGASSGTGEQAITLSYTSYPEPASLGLIGIGVMEMMKRRRGRTI